MPKSTANEISSNMNNASNGVQNITNNITVITDDAVGAEQTAQELLKAAGMLSNQSDVLNKKVKSFLEEIVQ